MMSIEQRQRLEAVLAGFVTAEAVDSSLAEAFSAAEPRSRLEVNFDFSEATFIEPVALQIVIASMLKLKQDGHSLLLRVPKERRVRDFWRAWGFPQAVDGALGTDEFRRIVPLEDRKYFGEPLTSYLPASLPAHPGFANGSVRSTNFFGFHTLSIDSCSRSTKAAYDEKDSWNVAHIQTVLANKLGRGSAYFASRVVFEAVLNALRHPGAQVVQSASIDAGGEKHGAFFATHFWDDGVSMAETLKRAIDAGKEFRGPFEEDFDRRYLLVCSLDGVPDSRTQTLETSQCSLELGLDLKRALFATVLPGVTSDPHGPNHSVAEELITEDVRFGRRGMGLYILVNAVVEVLGGSVAFRTGRYFMNIRRANKDEKRETGAHLRVRIKERPASLPEFCGNLVTVRLRVPRAS